MKRTKIPLLKQLADARGISSYDLIPILGKSQPTIDRYLREPDIMSSDMRKKLAKVLEISIDEIDDICNKKLKSLTILLKAC